MKVQLYNEREKWASYSQRGFTLGQSASVRQEQLFSVLKSKARGGWPKNATLCACVKMVIERLRKNELRTFLRILRSERKRVMKTKVTSLHLNNMASVPRWVLNQSLFELRS